jgi:hypothetical protein
MLCRRASRRKDRMVVSEGSWLLLAGHPQRLLTCEGVSSAALYLGKGSSLMIRAKAILVLVLLWRAELGNWHLFCDLGLRCG